MGGGPEGGGILDRRGPRGGSQTRTGGARTSRQKTESISHTQGTASEGRQNIQENRKKSLIGTARENSRNSQKGEI